MKIKSKSPPGCIRSAVIRVSLGLFGSVLMLMLTLLLLAMRKYMEYNKNVCLTESVIHHDNTVVPANHERFRELAD